MNEYIIDDYTGRLTGLYKDCMLNVMTIKGESPIKAVRAAYKPFGKIRKAKAFENPDIIIMAIRREKGRLIRTSGQMCYMFEEA